MFYDVAFRHGQALDPSALSSIGTSIHALTRAIDDCRRAGTSIETDPGVVLLARHLGHVATADRPTDMELRRSCLDAIAAIRRQPALPALAVRGVANDPVAKATFHAEAKRALRRLAEALGLEESSFQIHSNQGSPASSGDITLEADELSIEVALWPMCEGREVAFRRHRRPNQWASVHELVAPARFAARIRRELGLSRLRREPTRLSA
ncbi:MAG: hypothetical protein ABW128_10415 [Rhizorhabdus sp.]